MILEKERSAVGGGLFSCFRHTGVWKPRVRATEEAVSSLTVQFLFL